jgi:toxin ParE1/3/4
LPKYFLSDVAGSDLRGIVRYTNTRWSAEQALRYGAGLRECFRILARNPGIGRASDSISPGLRRFEYEKHVVFYRIVTGGIRISRVLHQRMLPGKSRFEA